jgi:hypothetical protein
LIRLERLIGTAIDPGVRSLPVAVLFETLDQVAKPAAQYAPHACAAEETAKIAQRAALTALTATAGYPAGALRQATKHFFNLVAVLITRNSEQSQ